MINSPASLRRFMTRHKLSNGQVADILGYKTLRYAESRTVNRMLSGEYNWEIKGHWVDSVLSKWVKKCGKK